MWAPAGANDSGYSYGLYIRLWVAVDSVGDTKGGGPPFMYPVVTPDTVCEVCKPGTFGILGAKMSGAPAGVGDRKVGKAVIPASGDVMNRAASETFVKCNYQQLYEILMQ